MPTDDDAMPSNGTATDHTAEVLALFAKDSALVDFCLERKSEMIEVKQRIKQEIPEVTIHDIESALEQHIARQKASHAASAKDDDAQFRKLQKGLQEGLLDVVEQIDRGYRITMWMYTIAFAVGITMLLTSTVTAFMHDVQRTAVLGGLGAADVIAFLIFKPAQELQNSRGSLAQLQAAFFAWINDIHNWNEYLDQLQGEAGSALRSFEQLKEISQIQSHTTEQMVRLIGSFTRPSEPISKRSSGHRETHPTDSHSKTTSPVTKD